MIDDVGSKCHFSSRPFKFKSLEGQARQGYLLIGVPWMMIDNVNRNPYSGEEHHATRQGLRQKAMAFPRFAFHSCLFCEFNLN